MIASAIRSTFAAPMILGESLLATKAHPFAELRRGEI
jgi:hypothetical protein